MLSDCNALFEQGFEILNRVYFGGQLPNVVITIQSSPKAYGYITVQKIWTDTQDCYHEINISAEHLTRPLEQVFATLQHELCHLYAMVNGIANTSKGGKYHNKQFKQIAEERGLLIAYVQYHGYTKTTPSEPFVAVLAENGLLDFSIDHCRRGAHSAPEESQWDGDNLVPKKKSSTRKYVCHDCGISVRATKDVNIACMDCECLMVKAD